VLAASPGEVSRPLMSAAHDLSDRSGCTQRRATTDHDRVGPVARKRPLDRGTMTDEPSGAAVTGAAGNVVAVSMHRHDGTRSTLLAGRAAHDVMNNVHRMGRDDRQMRFIDRLSSMNAGHCER
jgi:hypothetical protein